MTVIDSHQHFWQYDPTEYGWIDDSMQSLRRDFLPSDLSVEFSRTGVEGCIAVQARQSLEETNWLLALSRQSPFIRGVVGWLPLATAQCGSAIELFANEPAFKGARHIVQGEPQGFLLADAFNQGIRQLTTAGLLYDILIYARQLPEAIEFVDRHPNQLFVLDHIAKPNIRGREFDWWAGQIGDIARRPNVSCKLSGIVTEAHWTQWSPSVLKPYFETVLEAFGPTRLMAGSDWPVCTVAASYETWWKVVREWIDALSPSEQNGILGETATRVYKL